MRPSLRSLGPIALAATIVFATFAMGLLEPLEPAFQDPRASWFQHAPASDVVIVEIDARTVRALDQWPWSRNIHAALIDKLNAAKPRAVFFDVDFSVPSNDPRAD